MFRFSCFNAHIHSHKPKKTVHVSTEAMQKALEDCSNDQALKDFRNLTSTNSLNFKVHRDSMSNSGDHASSSSGNIESGNGVPKARNIRKSMSLGSGLDLQGRDPNGNNSEDETDQVFSCDGSNGRTRSENPVGGTDLEISVLGKYQETMRSDSLVLSSDMVNNGSLFSIGDPQKSEKDGNENSDTHFSGECHTPRTQPAIVKSNSLPNIGSYGNSISAYLMRRSRSSNDLNVLDSRQKEMLIMNEPETHAIQDQERDDSLLNSEKNSEKNNGENPVDDTYDTYDYVGSAKDWIIPVMDVMNTIKSLPGESESTVCRFEELTGKDFKIKRIEEWVMDLQHCSPAEEKETNEVSISNADQVQIGETVLDNLTVAKFDGSKVIPGTEVVKKYLSSLSATATAAQLANHGLVVIPFLSAFVSLRALNLSGNAIVRITAGALPRGLHILNLSKNSISTIEGLRELTRLRVLDLSYNRIVRIGHGLASCSALKELYLAGNKISEVEGLHRLLKLNVLDLRFNKISTTKCLGQLAANYNSLQAISLEGNPAQKNVGEEQLKKYLQGLLPHLVYLNRQSIKAKDATDRSTRLSIGSHQMDRGGRSELKSMRKASHGGASHKSSASSVHGRRSQPVAVSKQARGRHGRLPPSGTTKTTSIRANFYDIGSKMPVSMTDLSMRRSRSEGTLGFEMGSNAVCK
ncbi:hypothetical protein LguiA_022637 [Lonicera macranthoides]